MPPDAAPQKSIGAIANEGGLLPANPEDQDFEKLSLSDQINQVALESKFPKTVTAFVGDRRVELPPDQAEKALRAGTILLPKNQDLHVRLPDGSFKVVPPDQVNQHLADGASLSSAQEHHQADLAEKYDAGAGSGLAAVGLGLARGISTVPGGGSISDELIGWSPEAQEAARYIAEHRSTLSGIGEVGGMLAQQALMPGGGLAGLAEKGTAAAAGEGLAGRVLSQAARAGVENAQLAHTDMVSEQALGGPDVTSEKYLATIAKDALLGVGLGGGSALATEGLAAGLRALRRTPTATDLDGVASKAFGYTPKDGGIGDALVKAQSILSGADAEGKEAIKNAGVQNWTKEARDLRATAANIDEVRSTAVKDLSASMDTLLKKTEDIADESRGVQKRAQLKNLVSSPLDANEIQAHSMDSLQDVRNRIAEMAADGDAYGNAGALKRIDQQLRGHEKALVDAVEKGDQSEMFAVLDDTKRTIGGWSRKFQASARAGDPLAREQAQAVFEKLGDVERGGGIYEDLRRNLEDETTWGKAGAAQKEINAAWTDYIAATKQLGRSASVTSQVGENNFGRAIYGVDPSKMERYVTGLVNPSNDLAHKAMADYIQTAKKLAQAIDGSFELDAAKKAAVRDVVAASSKMETGLADIGDKLAKVNQIDALIKASRGPGGMSGGIVGHLVGGAIGGIAGAIGGGDDQKTGAAVGGLAGILLGGLANPGKNIMRLAQLENAVARVDSKVGGAISRFFRGTTKAAAKTAAKEGPTIRETFAKNHRALEKLSDHAVLSGRISPHSSELQGTAPQTAAKLGGAAVRAVGYLLARRPAIQEDPLTGDKTYPSLSQMQTWNMEVEATTHPDRVVDDFARGRVTVEQVNVLKNSFPALYGEVRAKVQQTLMDHVKAGRPVSYQKRVSLGILLDVDTDPSLAPPSRAHAQATFAPTTPAPPGQTPKAGGASSAGPSLKGKAVGTPAQKLEESSTL